MTDLLEFHMCTNIFRWKLGEQVEEIKQKQALKSHTLQQYDAKKILFILKSRKNRNCN